MASGRPILDLDAIIAELGSWGRYQKVNYILIMLPIFLAAIYKVQYVFVAGDMNYRCKVPECEKSSDKYKPGTWASFALPANEHTRRCHRQKPTGTSCTAESFSKTLTNCSSWVYESEETVVHTYNLACNELKRTFVGSVTGLGILFGVFMFSYISDRFGRKLAFIITTFLNGVFSVARAFSLNYEMHLVLEFLNSFFGSGVYSSGLILCLEMVKAKHRVRSATALAVAYAIGQASLAPLAYFIRYWRYLLAIIGAPGMCVLIYFFIIDESIRWLLFKDKHEKAIQNIKKIARANKVTFTPETQAMIDKYESDSIASKVVTSKELVLIAKENFKAIRKSRIIMMRLCVCTFWWIAVTFIYYGLSINAVSLAGDKYINYALVSLIEIPGYTLTVPTFSKLGRKMTLMCSFLFCGIGLVLIAFIPHYHWSTVLVVLFSKLLISLAYNGVYIYTVELFPTGMRHRALGLCATVGRIGSTVAPFTPAMILVWPPMPYVVFGTCSFFATGLLLLTPETLNQELPTNIKEAEDIGSRRTSRRPSAT